MSSSNDAGASTTRGRFYHELVTVKVEETIHRVPKYHLETWSTMFKDMFSLPQGPDAEGTSEENPIFLAGCTNSEFESLMEVLLTPVAIAPLTLTKDQWISVLKLSTVWEIPRARTLSVTKIKTLDISPTEMIRLGRKYKVLSLFVEGCAALAREDYGPEQLETLAATLGWDFSARIMWITSSRCPRPASVIGFPRDMARCLQCSAPLSLMESTELAPRNGPPLHMGPPPGAHVVTIPPPPVPTQPQMQPPLAPPPGPGPGPIPPHLIYQQSFMMQQQQQAQMNIMQNQSAALQMMAKRSLVVKYTCPTPGCRGVSSVSGLRLDLSAASDIGGMFSREDLSATIDEIFEDEMKDMY